MNATRRISSPKARWRRAVGLTVSLAGHGLILAALLLTVKPAPETAPSPTIDLALITLPPPAPSAKIAPDPAPKRPAEKKPRARRSLSPPRVTPAPFAIGDSSALSEAELAGAAGASSGSGGGACDITRGVQAALRKDSLVQIAVNGLSARAVRVWDGEWVQSRGEDGKGLAAVREAIAWEVAFAPKACQAQLLHGLVLVALPGPRGSTRLAIGRANWRWSDLLNLRR